MPFKFDALAPVISEKTMKLHYSKHHAGYVEKCNELLPKVNQALQDQDFKAYNELRNEYNFNYGGHFNHFFFWENLTPDKTKQEPSRKLAAALKKDIPNLKE